MVIGVGLSQEMKEGDAEWVYVVYTPDRPMHRRRRREIFSAVLDSPFGVRVRRANLLMVAGVDELDLGLWRRRLGVRVALATATSGAAVIASKRRTLRSSGGLVAAEVGRRHLGLSRVARD